MNQQTNEWWNNEEWAPFQEDFKNAYLAPLVAEAQRRTWEEAKEVIKDLLPKPSPAGMGECAFCGAWLDECHCNPGSIDAEALSEIFNAKINELK